MTLSIEHIALSVSNMDRSLEFYCDLLGMRIVRDMETGPGGLLERITRLKDCLARIVHLESGGCMLELFEYRQPEGRPIPQDRAQADRGFTHIGLKSCDIQADYERLRKKGVEFISSPVEFRPGTWVVYFRGPDGETCELRQS